MIVALVIVVLMVSCGLFGKTAVGLVKKALDNLKKVNSVKAEVIADYEGDVSYSFLSAPVTIRMDFDVEAVTKPAVSHAAGTVKGTLFGISMDLPVECYTQEEDGENAAYVSLDGKTWVRHKQEDTGGTGDAVLQFDRKAVLGILQKIAGGDIKAELAKETETIRGLEAYKISAKISGGALQELLEAAGAFGDGEGMDALPEGFDLSGAGADMDLYLYKKSGLPAQIRIDCPAVGHYVMQSLLADKGVSIGTDKFEITVTFTEYDTIDSIEIPEEVINGTDDGNGQGLFDNIIPGI